MGDTVFYMRTASPVAAALPLSDESIDDLRSLASQASENFDVVIQSLSQAPLFLRPSDLDSFLKKSIEATAAKFYGRVIRFLHRFHDENEGFFPLLKQLKNVTGEAGDQAFGSEALEILRSRIETLSQAWASLERQKKAETLAKATGQKLLTLNLLCDLRPIFDSTRMTIDGVLPVTTMHITVEGADGLPSGFDVTISEADLVRLQEQVEFAQSKIRSLTSLATKLDIPIPTLPNNS